MYFRRADGAFFIWWNTLDNLWVLSAVLGVEGVGWWASPTTAVPGTYTPAGTYTGNPVVAATP